MYHRICIFFIKSYFNNTIFLKHEIQSLNIENTRLLNFPPLKVNNLFIQTIILLLHKNDENSQKKSRKINYLNELYLIIYLLALIF